MSLLLIGSGLLIFELFKTQVLEFPSYSEAAESQSISQTKLPASRGRIIAQDRDGQQYTLAASQWRYQLLISPRQVRDKKKLAELLTDVLSQLKKEEIITAIDNDKVYIPPLVNDLDQETAEKVQAQNLAGVFVSPVISRVYPEADKVASQLLGFVGADGIGKYGVESYYDDLLRGQLGSEEARHDSLGRLIDVLNSQQSRSGSDLVLTIDYNFQFFVENKLKETVERYQADRGSIVAIDPTNGAILAAAGWPTYDPNNFTNVKAEDYGRFPSPIINSPYEPGSVFKPVNMAAAIDAGVVTPETTNIFGGEVTVADKTITNSEHKVYGQENMEQVLANSDNVAMVWVSGLLGAQKQRQYLEKFGFGKKTGVDVAPEVGGSLAVEKDWNELLRATASFGQGISVTPIQLATAYAALVNGGKLVTPHLALGKINNQGLLEKFNYPDKGQVVSAEAANKVKDMLVKVLDVHGVKAKVEGIKVGGKTGTAQVAKPTGGYEENIFIGNFAGFFPADQPKVAMVVRFDNPKAVKFAESSAAPTFGEIAAWATNYFALRK